MAFMDENFLLDTPTAITLFHKHAAACPIIDYHNHLAVPDIAKRRQFRNLTELWLETDHYKWRAMRACGVDESYITGDRPDWEKFQAWAEVLPQLVGSPLYHWAHLELQRYFGIYETLNPATAPKIWEQTAVALQQADFDAVRLLERQNVKVLCTTDDPADSLEGHRLIAQQGLPFQVLPTFRPDRFLNLETGSLPAAIADLQARNGCTIDSMEDLQNALCVSFSRFQATGCKVSDHGFSCFAYGTGDQAELAFRKAAAGEIPSEEEMADYKGAMLRFLGKEYAQRGIIMQLHIGPLRNTNPSLYASFGADAGGDSVGLTTDPFALAGLLGDLEKAGALPRTIIYNLNPADNTLFSTMAVNFAPKVQYGAAWWLNDTIRGIGNQIEELMETGQLAKSIGMLTDSRSFTSFPRHEYFRRILCAKLGQLVASGQYPEDLETLGKLVEDICWRNAMEFFAF